MEHHGPNALDRSLSCLAKAPVECNLLACFRLGEVKDPAGDRQSRHLLETQRLSAKLDCGVAGVNRPARLVLDGHDRCRLASRVGEMELHDVALADQAQPLAPNRQGPFDPDTLLSPGKWLVGPLVRDRAADGEDVLVPNVLEVDQPTLARTVAPVLKSANLDENCFGYPMSRIRVTPVGKLASSTWMS